MKRFAFVLSLSLAWAFVAAPAFAESDPTVIAIYDHSDGSADGPKNLIRILTEEHGFRCVRVTPDAIREGALETEQADVLIVPGGSGSLQAKKLGDDGREVVREFVREGGGYVGICAGSYLASSDYDWSLNLLNAKVFDRAHWARGTGDVQVELTDAGKDSFGKSEDEMTIYYGQGPLLIPDDEAALPAFEPLGLYATEIAKKGAPTGVMIGTTAIARAQYGEGRVFCFSCHPEKEGGPNELIRSGVGWAAKREVASDTPVQLAPASPPAIPTAETVDSAAPAALAP